MKVRYQAIAPLLAGEGSRAFLGLEISEGQKARPVVLIWAPEESAADEALKTRLLHETRRAAALQHPNIIRVHGLAAMEDGLARIVEFADGESLRRILDVSKTLPPDYAALVAAEAASGVHFAHLSGNEDGTPWVHGDVRPETVMVSFNGQVKMTGYGALAVAPKELYGKRVLGRRTHSAPEQVLAGRQAATVETDVYLLGVLLYETLTGQVPFGAEKNFDQAVVSQPLPHANYESIPLGLVEVIHQATAKKTQERYPSALAFRQAVEQAMGVLPSPDELGRYIRQHFPEGEETRAARRHAIDAAIAEFARKQWELSGAEGLSEPVDLPELEPLEPGQMPNLRQLAAKQEYIRRSNPGLAPPPSVMGLPVEPPAEPPPLAPAEVAPAPVAPAAVAAAPAVVPAAARVVAPAPAPVPAVQVKPEPRPASGARWWLSALIAASLAFGISGVVFGLLRKGEPPAVKKPASEVVPAVAAAPAVAVAPSPAVEPGPPSHPAPVPVAPPPPPKAPVPSEPGEIVLKVDPPVEVTMDGKRLGRTPLSVPVPNGKHTFKLTNADLGISVTRTLKVAGKTRQEWSIGKGSVMVSAPDGATVALDGKVMGKAPVKEIPAYEGQHRILVTLGKAKYSQPFALRPEETMYITVELAPQE